MKKLISKHYRKIFSREPKAFFEVAEELTKREEIARILSGEPGEGDCERFLLETHLALHKAYGPVKAFKIEKQFIKLIAMMWR